MSSVAVMSADPARLDHASQAVPRDGELRPATTLKGLSDAVLWGDTTAVILDVEHPGVDPLEAVRLVKGTRWDVRLLCIGEGVGAARAAEGGVEVLARDAWQRLPELLAY